MISDRVVVFSYLDVNVSAIVSNVGIVIIDTNRSPKIMEKIKKEIENIFGRNDFIYVINTHGHWDHCSGNQLYDNAKIIGHKNCVEYISHNTTDSPLNIWLLEQRISKMRYELTIQRESAANLTEKRSNIIGWDLVIQDLKNDFIRTPPTITFSDSLILNVGDLTLKMIYCGNAHTNNDIFIYIPEEKLVFTSDMFTTESRFGFSINKLVDAQRIISSMETIIQDKNGVEYIIPGHGELFPGNVFEKLKNLLIKKYNKIRDEESAVKFLENTLEEFEPDSALKKYVELNKLKRTGRYYWSEDEFNILGRRYMAMGMIDKAIVVFTIEVESFPKSALAYDNLGEAYLRNGEKKLAKENYKKSLVIYPDNKNAQRILKFLSGKYN
jgi:glyoxylase-like metal-dependent hydrolase (beta-lactamase superfamily II)